jgi:hypothetical protein
LASTSLSELRQGYRQGIVHIMRIPNIGKVFVRLVLSSNVKVVQHPWHHDGTHPTLSLVLFFLQHPILKHSTIVWRVTLCRNSGWVC